MLFFGVTAQWSHCMLILFVQIFQLSLPLFYLVYLLTWITNGILDQLDEETKDIAQTDYFFDSVR